MLLLLKQKKAQSTLEYALIIAVVIGAFTAMQLYTRRGLQSRVKSGVDNIPGTVLTQEGEGKISVEGLFSSGGQYEPYYYSKAGYDMTSVTSEGNRSDTVSESGGSNTLSGATSQRTGTQAVTGTNVAD